MKSNPLSETTPWNLVAEGYEQTTMPLFEPYANKAISLGPDLTGKHILDLCCGPGTFSRRVYSTCQKIDAVDFSQKMLDCFGTSIQASAIQNIVMHNMDGQKLDFPDNRFDAAYSLFGLMFFPDRMAGFKQLHRTLRPGGTAVVSSWAPVSDSPLMSLLFGSMKKAFPEQPESKTEILNLENPDVFENEMKVAGFKNIKIEGFSADWEITDVESFLDDMIKGSAPLVMMKEKLGPDIWKQKYLIILDHLHTQIPNTPIRLGSKAWFGSGQK